MNKLSVITGFLGAIKNRYMVYQEDRPLAEKLSMAGRIEQCDGVELCYPADFEDPDALRDLLEEHELGVSAVNFRSRRAGRWLRGSFTSEDPAERQEVADDLRRAMDFAAGLGCSRVTTCPLNDGSDTPFEMDYTRIYGYATETFRAPCEQNQDVRVCIEFKRSDPRARCVFGTAGETASFCQTTGLENLGVTLDIGHALYGGERPAQSAALLARADRLFYVHLNDNDGRWDWDLLPGAYHLWESVELLYTLRKLGYEDDWFAFDVFPKEIDTVQNYSAALNLTRKLEEIVGRIEPERMEELMSARNPAATIPYLYSLL